MNTNCIKNIKYLPFASLLQQELLSLHQANEYTTMMISIANPIYDAVFKYLMEDNRVAKTVLSALLKREVVEVEMRKHEYTNGTRDKISMFRIDFGAKVRQDDGSLNPSLIP